MVRLQLVGEVGSESLQGLRIGIQSDKKTDRSVFCKCFSRVVALYCALQWVRGNVMRSLAAGLEKRERS